MKYVILLASVILVTACHDTLDKPMSLEWTRYEPEITGEPNFHFMLKTEGKDFCIVSLSKENLDKNISTEVTTPGNPVADIDCYLKGTNYILDDSGTTFFKSKITTTGNGKVQISTHATLNDFNQEKHLTVNQAVMIKKPI